MHLEIPKRSLCQQSRFCPPSVPSWKAGPTALHAVCSVRGLLFPCLWVGQGDCRNECGVGFLSHYYLVSTVMFSFLKMLKMSSRVCTSLWVPLLLSWSGMCSDWHLSQLTNSVKAGTNAVPPVQVKKRYAQPVKFYFKQNWDDWI